MSHVANRKSNHSVRWIERHINDRYVMKAQQENYRSRAAYKLMQMDDRFCFLKRHQVVVDLGCYPGGWSQVALERTYCDGSSRGVVLGVDKVRMDPLLHHTFIQGDVSHKEILDRCFNVLGDRRADVVLSDMAPKLIGVKQDDHLASAETALFACDFVEQVLKLGGWFIVKLFYGGQGDNLKVYLKTRFERVRSVKPRASRNESREMYFICEKFIGRPKLSSEVQVKSMYMDKGEGYM